MVHKKRTKEKKGCHPPATGASCVSSVDLGSNLSFALQHQRKVGQLGAIADLLSRVAMTLLTSPCIRHLDTTAHSWLQNVQLQGVPPWPYFPPGNLHEVLIPAAGIPLSLPIPGCMHHPVKSKPWRGCSDHSRVVPEWPATSITDHNWNMLPPNSMHEVPGGRAEPSVFRYQHTHHSVPQASAAQEDDLGITMHTIFHH